MRRKPTEADHRELRAFHDMRRTFSCPSTFFWKYVLTSALIGGAAYWLLMCWAGKFTHTDGKPFLPVTLVVFTLLGAVVVSAVIAATRKLKRVAVEDGCLCVSNYFTEVRIPLSEVVSVREYSGPSAAKQYTALIIDLQSACAFGKRIVFLPQASLLLVRHSSRRARVAGLMRASGK